MSDIEAAVEARPAGAEPPTATVLVGIASPVDATLLRRRAHETANALRTSFPTLSMAVAYPGTAAYPLNAYPGTAFPGAESPPMSANADAADGSQGLHFVEYELPASAASAVPWLGVSPAYRLLAQLAADSGATACVVLSPDLAAFDARSIQALTGPVLDRRADLAMPIYALSKFEGLLNSGILYPFTRALYGRRVRYPLGPDFGVSVELLGRLAKPSSRAGAAGQEPSAVWPVTEAVASDNPVAQVHLDGRHGAQNDGLDLNTVLGHLAGSLFSDAEKQAVLWQRIRGSQACAALGAPAAPVGDVRAVDTRPMLEAFYLASRNLQEVWGLVLPPVTLLELKRLVRIAPEEFRMADSLWARIVYDFALAYRLRTLSRTHLLGALTPLYLGWVASYVQEIADADAMRAEQRVERLAKAYEDEKAYLVSRWRWPDRFNP